jgi:transcriptional regulator with XRE-family HTH domain
MRARRARKISLTQLADELGENEMTLKMVESGILPEDNFRVINKLEIYFKIALFRKEYASLRTHVTLKPSKLAFDPFTTKELTISDLRDMKNKQKESSGEQGAEEEVSEGNESKENVEEKDKVSVFQKLKGLFSRKKEEEKKEEVVAAPVEQAPVEEVKPVEQKPAEKYKPKLSREELRKKYKM